jgi:hypothetical protein
MLELGDGPATIRHPRCRRVTMAMQNLVEVLDRTCVQTQYCNNLGASYMQIVFERRTRNCFLPLPSSWEHIY